MKRYLLLRATPLHDIGETVFISDVFPTGGNPIIRVTSIDKKRTWCVRAPELLSERFKLLTHINPNITIL